MRSKPRLGVALANGWNLKTFVNSGLVEALSQDFEMCAWARPGAIKALQAEMDRGETPRIKLFPAQSTAETNWERAIRQSQKSLFAARHRFETEEIKKQTSYRSLQRMLAALIAWPARSPLGSAALGALDPARCRAARRDFYAKDFDEFKPEALVLGHAIDLNEWVLSLEAKARGIPVIGSVLSWDNLTSKGMMGTFYERVLVWNKTMQQEVFDYYPMYRNEQVKVVGVPRFQPCLAPLPSGYDRETFFKSLGLDPKKKMILFATSASSTCPDQPAVARHLLEAIRNGELGDCQVLFRRHPRDDSEMPDSPELKMWRQSVANLDVENWTPDRADGWIFAAMLRHAAVNVNPASTVTLEAALCDLPVINLAYDGDEEKPYAKSIRRYYDYSHQKPLLRFGATAMARTREELIAQVREAIDHPEIRRKERREMANWFCSLDVGDPVEATARAIREVVSRN